MILQQLQKEIKQLKALASRELDVKKQAELMKQYHTKALEFLELVSADEKSRAGMTGLELREYIKTLPKVPKYEVGINAFDEFLGGFETGLFINLAAESGAGKTTTVLDIVTNIAKGRKSVFFSFEMGKKLLNSKLYKMQVSDEQLENLILDFDNSDLDDLVREIELYAYEGIKFFGIDSKMKISVKGNDPEHLKISKISSTLSKLCAKKDIIIFLINQISEDDIKSKRLSLKGSGDQKYDADLLFFLTIDKDEKRWLHCTKNRMSDILFKTEITKKHNAPIVYEFKGDDNIKIDMPCI